MTLPRFITQGSPAEFPATSGSATSLATGYAADSEPGTESIQSRTGTEEPWVVSIYTRHPPPPLLPSLPSLPSLFSLLPSWVKRGPVTVDSINSHSAVVMSEASESSCRLPSYAIPSRQPPIPPSSIIHLNLPLSSSIPSVSSERTHKFDWSVLILIFSCWTTGFIQTVFITTQPQWRPDQPSTVIPNFHIASQHTLHTGLTLGRLTTMYWLPWLLTLPVFTHWADVGEPILVMYFGYMLWLVGCALGMFSHITGVVETVRVLEGLGSAATFGCCVVILAKIQDGSSENGSRWSRFWLAALRGLFWGGWSSCVVMGALVGEITLKRLDWHALYVVMLVTVGVQLGTLLFCKGFSWFYVTNDIITPPNLDKGGCGRVDFWGITLYLGSLACFLLWMLLVSHVVPWDKPGVVTTILCGTVFGLGLIVQQLQRPCHSALLPLRPDGYQWTLVVYVLGVFTTSTLLFAIVAHWHHYLIFVAVSSWKLSLAFILPLWVTAGVLGWGAVVASVTWGTRTMSIVLTVAVTCLLAATSILAFVDIGSTSQSLTWSSITLSGLGLGVALPTFFTLGQRRNSDGSCSIPATRLLLVVLSLGGWTGLWFQSFLIQQCRESVHQLLGQPNGFSSYFAVDNVWTDGQSDTTATDTHLSSTYHSARILGIVYRSTTQLFFQVLLAFSLATFLGNSVLLWRVFRRYNVSPKSALISSSISY